MTTQFDPRLFAFRPDLAEAGLSGLVDASRFVEGELAHVIDPVADLRPAPDLSRGIDTQLLYGEDVRVFERHEGWAWVKSEMDGYVGYMSETSLVDGPNEATHIVSVPRTFLYPGPDLRFPSAASLSMGSRLNITGEAETRGTRYFTIKGGQAVIAAHTAPIGQPLASDPLTVAARFLETPYLWGGRSGFGIDCSGLVQMAFAMTGIRAPRDSDMQAANFGDLIDPASSGLRRGDLVFWKGHVAMMEDETVMLHASGGTMSVTREPLKAAIDRIRPLYGEPKAYRRVTR